MFEKIKERTEQWYKSHVSYLTVTPILVTCAIIVASVIIGTAAARNLDSVQAQTVDKQLRENSLLIQNRFSSYEQVVWSEAGRLNSGPLDRNNWAAFVNTYQLPQNFPAISRLAVTRMVRPDEKEAYLRQLSAEYGQDITITNDTDGSADILIYSSPEQPTTINNIGFNILSDPNRSNATQRATDTNNVTMTEQVELLLNAKNKQTKDDPAFIMYAPYYQLGVPLDTVEQRRAAILGHVFASFETKKVFEQIFNRIDRTHTSVKVSTNGETSKKNTVVYEADATNPKGSKLVRHQTVEVNGQTFAIDYEFDRNYLVSTTQLNAPIYMAFFGSLVGILVGTVTFFFLRGRYHQVLLDKERDVTRAKDELLSLASHQLRTPATGVKQYMGMVLQGFSGPISDTQKEFLTKAYKSNERQLAVINDILHLAKLDLGRIVLAKTNFDLAELVRDVVDEQEQDIEAGNLTIQTNVMKKAPINADKHMLRMVVENLVSNAIKYTGPGGKVTVNLQHKDEGYYITVKDTGVGISLEDTPMLFKQFSRIQNERSHLVTGTGVGLYLSRHLTQLHDGDIAVESEAGKGSSFIVYIPKNIQKL